ncbi:hypothetical protein ACS15_4458 [Ralstonia insidiosa]|uniref:Uncharacterized protein n=1 Tax=Ralstonia insidiosa TaxID=190721 RepID=A0AAC9BMP6_9RALS|nr:hypothetical protein ACS15_4458 [Ralstonia insidiosa]
MGEFFGGISGHVSLCMETTVGQWSRVVGERILASGAIQVQAN